MKKLKELSHYCIGDISKMLGLSIAGLRLYEQKGMLEPARDCENRYRYYNFMDLAGIIINLFFRGFGFSMNESCALYNADSPEALVPMLKAREEALEEEIRWNRAVLKHLKMYREEMAHAKENVGRYCVVNHPAMYCLKYHDEGDICLTREEQKEFQRWIKHMPFVRVMTTYPLTDFQTRHSHIVVYLGIEEDWARDAGFDPGPMAGYLPSRKSIETMIYEPASIFDYQCLDDLYAYLERNGLEPIGDPIVHCDFMARDILHIENGYKLQRYRKTWVPIA